MKRYLQVDKDLNIIKSKPLVKKKSTNLPIVKFGDIGYYILAPLIVGVFLGVWLKQVVLFIFLGTLAAFYNLYKIYKNG